MEVKNYFATDASGNILGSAQVYVYLAGTTNLATGLQNINGASLSNPFTAQANGLVQFQAPDNDYDMRVVKLGRDFTIRIQCFDGVAFLSLFSTEPVADGIPRSDENGFISEGWLPPSIARPSLMVTTNVDDFGADNKGLVDSSAAFIAAADFAFRNKTKLVGRGAYLLNQNVMIRYTATDFSSCDIKIGHAGIGLTIGGNSNIGGSPAQFFGYVYRVGGATTVPTVRIMGSKDQHTTVTRSDFIQMYADTDSSAQTPMQSGSAAYNRIDVDICEIFELDTNEATTGSLVQWLNENTLNIKRVTVRFTVKGTYGHNHNIINGGAFEGNSSIDIQTGYSNLIRDVRFEGNPTVTFGPGTYHNTIICNWYSSTAANPEQANNVVVTNNGSPTNLVITDFRHMREYATVAYTDISEVVLNGEQDSRFGRSSDLQRIRGNSVQIAVQSGYLPVVAGDFFFFGQDFNSSLDSRYRPRIDFYDEKLRPIASSVGLIDSVYFTTYPTTNSVSSGSGQQRVWCLFTQATAAGAKFCKVGWTYAQSQLSLGNARALWVKRAGLSSSLNATIGAYAPAKLLQSVVSAAPIAGFAPVGYRAVRNNGVNEYVNIFALDTALTSGGTGASTSIVVALATGVSVGDIIGVDLDDMTTHWTTVSSVSGTTIGLTAALASASANGQRVVFNRWSAKTL